MITTTTTALMIPSAASNDGYRTTFSAASITVDGEPEDIYKQSELISSTHVVAGSLGSTSDSGFIAYTAVTANGLYVWAEIKDNSLDKNSWESPNHGDKFQVYLKIDNGSQSKWGWYHVDYNGRVAKGSYSANITLATRKLANGLGWRAEMFIPFEGNVPFTNIDKMTLSVGMQANNGRLNSGKTEANYSAGSDVNHTHIAYCYDTSNGSGYWQTSDNYVPLVITKSSDVPTDTAILRSAVYTAEAPVINGEKDAIYSEFGKIKLDKIYACSTTVDGVSVSAVESGAERSSLGDVYVAFDNNNLYIYFETNEPDASGSVKDYLQIYYRFNTGSSIVASYFCSYIDGSDNYFGATAANNGYPSGGISESSMSIASKTNGSIYSLEYRIPLPAAEVSELADNGSVTVDLAFSVNDYRADGVRRYYGGDTVNSPHLWSYANEAKFPSVSLDRSITSTSSPAITGASLSLGADIAVNYYAVLPPSATDAQMRFTMNGNTFYADAQMTDAASEYRFVFKGLAPQTIGDTIKAELIVNGTAVAVKNDYSVLENCQNLLLTYQSDEKITNLVTALLNYGAAAQKYTFHNTDRLVNEGIDANTVLPTSTIKNLGANISNDLKITSVGVRYENSNRLYVKFKATSLNGVTVTFNGDRAIIEACEDEENTYIAYSNEISVLHFATKYTVRLSNGSGAQNLTYSVNSYAYAMQSSEDIRMKELASATYAYGVAVSEYMDIFNRYTVITYNDGDNSTTKTAQVAELLNAYSPDFIGMQEVQAIHVPVYEDLLNGNYVGVYYDHDETRYGAPIFYNADKFDIVSTIEVNGKTISGTGTKWLSDTPDTISKFSDSAYIRSFVYAVFRDKATGQKLVMINTHIDYTGSANIKQVEKLLELTQNCFGDIPVFYTADWNMYKTSAGYAKLAEAGYAPTETFTGETITPGTMVGSSGIIDFCFIDSEKMTALDYKVINDHMHSDTASDHYAIYSEISVLPTETVDFFNGYEEKLQ